MRAGRRRALEQLLPRYGIDAAGPPPRWDQIFAGRDDLYVEIGAGYGEAAAQYAAQHPDCAYVAFEVYPAGIAETLKAIDRHGLDNLKVVAADARPLLASWFAPGQLAGVNLFFPDPWPKRRHHKRRLGDRRFIALIGRLLAAGGLFHFATDWPDYRKQVGALLANESWSVLADDPPRGSRPLTRYERRALAAGRPVWDVRARAVGCK